MFVPRTIGKKKRLSGLELKRQNLAKKKKLEAEKKVKQDQLKAKLQGWKAKKGLIQANANSKTQKNANTAPAPAPAPVPAPDLQPEVPSGPHIPWLMGCRSVENFRKVHQETKEGTHGVVFRVEDMGTKEIRALKQVKWPQREGYEHGFPMTALREINVLRELDHPNIIKLHEVVCTEKGDGQFMVLEYMPHDLQQLMHRMLMPFRQEEAKVLLKQLLSALVALHKRFVHRDIKPANILLDDNGILKLCDFGDARLVTMSHMTPNVCSFWYRAPEVFFGARYDKKVDMWAVGCVFYEFLTGNTMCKGSSELDQVQLIFKLLGTPTKKQWPEFQKLLPKTKFAEARPVKATGLRKTLPPEDDATELGVYLSDKGMDLLKQFLQYDPKKRISAEEALKHPYFDEEPTCEPKDIRLTVPTVTLVQKKAIT